MSVHTSVVAGWGHFIGVHRQQTSQSHTKTLCLYLRQNACPLKGLLVMLLRSMLDEVLRVEILKWKTLGIHKQANASLR